jgi:hypothetical protein
MDEMSIEAGRDSSEISVEMMARGLWKVEGEYVVEGDCPVSLLIWLGERYLMSRCVEKDCQVDMDLWIKGLDRLYRSKSVLG